jgi:hypothetical protein
VWPVASRQASLCLVFGLSLAAPARAQQAAEPQKKYSAWQSEEYTPFIASASDLGIVYFRPHLTAGWGAPFWQFVGVDAYAISTNSFAAGYVGWRASLPWLDVQWGYRRTYAYNRQFLTPRDKYDDGDLDLPEDGERSSYEVIELEITPAVPLFGGAAFAEIHPMWIFAPRDRHVYEEVLRAVADSYFAMRTRLGYVYSFGTDGNIKVGGMVEYVVLPQRPGNVTRVGPVALISVSKSLEILGTTTIPISSPDDLGIYQGSYGLLGIRYRFAERF